MSASFTWPGLEAAAPHGAVSHPLHVYQLMGRGVQPWLPLWGSVQPQDLTLPGPSLAQLQVGWHTRVPPYSIQAGSSNHLQVGTILDLRVSGA